MIVNQKIYEREMLPNYIEMGLTDTEETLVLEIDAVDENLKKVEEDEEKMKKATIILGFLALFLFFIGMIGFAPQYYNGIVGGISGVALAADILVVLFLFGAFFSFVKDGNNEEKIMEYRKKLIESLNSLGIEYVPKAERLKIAEQLKNVVVKQEMLEQPKAETEKPKTVTTQVPVKITLNNEEEGFFD